MKKFIIIFLLIANPLQAEKIERLGFYNLQEILEDDNLTYKIIKGCVSLNSAVTEIIKEEHPDLANEFFKSANYLYPFGVLVLMKIDNISQQDAEKKYFLGTLSDGDIRNSILSLKRTTKVEELYNKKAKFIR